MEATVSSDRCAGRGRSAVCSCDAAAAGALLEENWNVVVQSTYLRVIIGALETPIPKQIKGLQDISFSCPAFAQGSEPVVLTQASVDGFSCPAFAQGSEHPVQGPAGLGSFSCPAFVQGSERCSRARNKGPGFSSPAFAQGSERSLGRVLD